MAMTFQEASEKFEAMKKRMLSSVMVAADEARIVAMERSPHKGDAGVSLTTGNLASHWEASVTPTNGGFVFSLKNTVPYASYVNDGHRMRRHFVPWLYVDANGILRKEKPIPGEPVYGLVVGTKTSYVKPHPMVEPAIDRFFEVLRRMTENTDEKE